MNLVETNQPFPMQGNVYSHVVTHRTKNWVTVSPRTFFNETVLAKITLIISSMLDAYISLAKNCLKETSKPSSPSIAHNSRGLRTTKRPRLHTQCDSCWRHQSRCSDVSRSPSVLAFGSPSTFCFSKLFLMKFALNYQLHDRAPCALHPDSVSQWNNQVCCLC